MPPNPHRQIHKNSPITTATPSALAPSWKPVAAKAEDAAAPVKGRVEFVPLRLEVPFAKA